MRRLMLAVVGISVAFAALHVPSLRAGSQSPNRFEYMRLAPGLPGNSQPKGYAACVAGAAEWTCRPFESKDASFDSALRSALATLGGEGWELVSIFDETQNLSYPKGLTYVFKRRVAE